MRFSTLSRLAIAAVLLVPLGCSSNNKGQIEDTDWISQAATVHGQALPAGARELHFNQDGQHLTYRDGAKVYQGTYSLGMGPTVTFHLDEELDGRKIHAEKVVLDGEQL